LATNVADKKIKEEDIYKYEKYFKIFNKYKKYFKYPDILRYKEDGVRNFEKEAIEAQDKISGFGVDTEGGSTKNLVTPDGIEELKNVGIEFLGTVEGYQSFKIPKKLSGDEASYKTYRKILGKCGKSDEDEDKESSNINICTFASYGHYKQYLKNGDLYVFFNRSDSLSPYQFSYEAKQFMDRKNQSVV
jgi:hypothetical protein